MQIVAKEPYELVSILITETHISIGLIGTTSAQSAPLCVRAFRSHALEGSIINGALCKPYLIEKQITDFVRCYGLKQPYVSLCFAQGNSVYEHVVAVEQSNPQPHHFAHLKLANLCFDYTFLHSNDTGQFVFYIAGIRKEIIFQYQLLALKLKLTLVTITTATQAFLAVYKALYGTAFRQAQLAHDMQRCNYQLEQLFTTDMLKRMLSTASLSTIESNKQLIALAGLYLSESELP